MALRALPPDLAPRSGGHLLRRQRGVSRCVPLARQLRRDVRQRILSRRHEPARADRTPAAGHAGADLRPPGVPLFAPPPHKAVAARGKVGRRARRVFWQVPLRGQLRIERREVVALPDLFARAVGAAGALGPRVDCRLPCVSVRASPPHRRMAAVCDRFRRQRQVAHRVPFVQQAYMPIPAAEGIQALSHIRHPRSHDFCLSPHNFSYVINPPSEQEGGVFNGVFTPLHICKFYHSLRAISRQNAEFLHVVVLYDLETKQYAGMEKRPMKKGFHWLRFLRVLCRIFKKIRHIFYA